MITLIAIGMMFLNSHTASQLPSFACQVSNLGVPQAVSLALGQGHNIDGWMEGALFTDLHLSREISETIVNDAHTALFGGPVTPELVVYGDTGSCE